MGWRPLASAAERDHLEVVHLLLEQGSANIRAVNDDGYTPLFVAMERGHFEIA